MRYAKYKPTGTTWVKSIPIAWDCKKISALFSQRKTKVSDTDYPALSVTKSGVVPQLANAAKSNDSENRKLVCAGDFVINSRSDRKGSCGVSELDGSVSLINIVLTPRHEWNKRYVHYLLRSQPFAEEYYHYGRGIVADLWTTRYSEMKSILLPVPPREEQDQIVSYLDWQVSKINMLITAKKKQIALFEECRNHTITTVVSQGIEVPLKWKATDITWMGRIPATWSMRQFFKIATVCANLVSPEDYPDFLQVSPASIEKNTGRLFPCGTVKEAGIISDNHRFYSGQILYSKIRPLLNKVTIAPFDGLCSADMYPIETRLVTKYLVYYMLSNKFLSQLSMTGNRVKMPKINKEELSTVLVLVPPQNEQKQIVEYLDKRCKQIDSIMEDINQEISALHELRTRLISDVVTGQIDVRNIAIPDFELVDEIDDEESPHGEVEPSEVNEQ